MLVLRFCSLNLDCLNSELLLNSHQYGCSSRSLPLVSDVNQTRTKRVPSESSEKSIEKRDFAENHQIHLPSRVCRNLFIPRVSGRSNTSKYREQDEGKGGEGFFSGFIIHTSKFPLRQHTNQALKTSLEAEGGEELHSRRNHYQ